MPLRSLTNWPVDLTEKLVPSWVTVRVWSSVISWLTRSDRSRLWSSCAIA